MANKQEAIKFNWDTEHVNREQTFNETENETKLEQRDDSSFVVHSMHTFKIEFKIKKKKQFSRMTKVSVYTFSDTNLCTAKRQTNKKTNYNRNHSTNPNQTPSWTWGQCFCVFVCVMSLLQNSKLF